ncbi:phosphonate metabolism PhnM [Desulfovibrio sp. X2]|nr:phosphonate metabolism PhnM [Desulfovibrio sp. X2]
MTIIRNGSVLLPDGTFEDRDVHVADGIIVSLDGPRNGRTGTTGLVVDAAGLLVLPGLVDLHGDAFERQLMPRPGVSFPHVLALVETDRQMAASGITTAFHGLTCSFEPGLRSLDAAIRFLDELDAARPLLGCDTRVHLRFENHNLDAAPKAEAWIDSGRVDLLSFNDHLAFMLARLDDRNKMTTYLARTGLSRDDFAALLRRAEAHGADVPAALGRLAAAARARNLPIASHDDPSPEVRGRYRALGSRVSDFPETMDTARAARDHHDAVILGAPNVVRGASHDKRLTAMDAIANGLCDVLASDYFYPALPQAPFILDRRGLLPLGKAWDLVSANPALAAGLDDRGRIAEGLRADLVLVDTSRPDLPRVRLAMAGGKIVFGTCC